MGAPGTTPVYFGRHAGKRWYVGPDRKLMRFADAKASYADIESLEGERDVEIAHAVATGLGDHAKIARLDAALALARGEPSNV